MLHRFFVFIRPFSIGIFIAACILWLIILSVFLIIKFRNARQRKKYSVKQDGDVSTEYHTRGLQ